MNLCSVRAYTARKYWHSPTPPSHESFARGTRRYSLGLSLSACDALVEEPESVASPILANQEPDVECAMRWIGNMWHGGYYVPSTGGFIDFGPIGMDGGQYAQLCGEG